MLMLFLLVTMSAAPHWTKSEEEEEVPTWDSAEYPHHHFVDYIESTCNFPYLFIANIFYIFSQNLQMFSHTSEQSLWRKPKGEKKSKFIR